MFQAGHGYANLPSHGHNRFRRRNLGSWVVRCAAILRRRDHSRETTRLALPELLSFIATGIAATVFMVPPPSRRRLVTAAAHPFVPNATCGDAEGLFGGEADLEEQGTSLP